MKTSNFFKNLSYPVMFGAAVLFSSCDSSTNQTTETADDAVVVEEDMADTYDAAEQSFETRRTTLQTELDNEINETERELEQWRQDAENATAEARAEMDSAIARGETKLENLNEEKMQIGEATEENWEEFERDARNAIENTGNEIETETDEVIE